MWMWKMGFDEDLKRHQITMLNAVIWSKMIYEQSLVLFFLFCSFHIIYIPFTVLYRIPVAHCLPLRKKITLKIGTCRSVNKKRGPPSYRTLVTACIHTGGKDQHHLHHALVFSKPSTLCLNEHVKNTSDNDGLARNWLATEHLVWSSSSSIIDSCHQLCN
jgi:hypothetical protein